MKRLLENYPGTIVGIAMVSLTVAICVGAGLALATIPFVGKAFSIIAYMSAGLAGIFGTFKIVTDYLDERPAKRRIK